MLKGRERLKTSIPLVMKSMGYWKNTWDFVCGDGDQGFFTAMYAPHACTHACKHACTHAYTHACTHAYTHASVSYTHLTLPTILLV